MMNKKRKKMLDRMIKIYGSERNEVIQFAEYCRNAENNKKNDFILSIIVEAHEENPNL